MPVLLRAHALLPESRIWKYFGSPLVLEKWNRDVTNPSLFFSVLGTVAWELHLGGEVYPIERFFDR